MIVEPAPAAPRGAARRGPRVLGLATPVLLLLAVAGAGLLGRSGEGPPREAPSLGPGPSVAEAAPLASPTASAPPIPAVEAGLPVLGVVDARPALVAVTGVPLAVAGRLGSLRTDPACATARGDTRGLLSPLCGREARLVPVDSGDGAASAHLHVHIPPGVRLPPVFETADTADAASIVVVILGRPARPDDVCRVSPRGCGELLTADRIAWADDAPFDPGPVFDAGLEVPRPAIAYRYRTSAESLAAGANGRVLVSALVRPATVAAIDPEAAEALMKAPRPEGLVWYVRGLATDIGRPRYPPGESSPQVRWVLVDQTTGNAIASGPATQPTSSEP